MIDNVPEEILTEPDNRRTYSRLKCTECGCVNTIKQKVGALKRAILEHISVVLRSDPTSSASAPLPSLPSPPHS